MNQPWQWLALALIELVALSGGWVFVARIRRLRSLSPDERKWAKEMERKR